MPTVTDVDARVASAVAHWAPRFTANGVTVWDFERVTHGLERWADWCAAWCTVGEDHEVLGRQALEQGRTLSAGEHLVRAAACYHFGKFVFVEDLDQMRDAHARAVRCHTDALPHLRWPGEKIPIPFEGAQLMGVLRLPDGERPHPVVLLLPGLDSTKEELVSTEETFLARGLATFSVDGPGQGEAEYDLPIRGDWTAPAEVLYTALATRSDVDVGRLAVWGVSLGGYYSARVAAALGHRVAACVSLAGPFDFGACWPGLPELTRATFQVRARANDPDDARRIAATLSLQGCAGDITAPLLVVFGRQDRLIPWQQAERLRDEAGVAAELLLLEEGNHGCANVWPWHRPFTADWLGERLGTLAAGARIR